MSDSEHATLVLALGNSLAGDDGVGTTVLHELAAMRNLPGEVTISFRGQNGLLDALVSQSWQRIILVDAANMGRQPGEWVRFTPDLTQPANWEMSESGTVHQLSLAGILMLANTAIASLPEIVIFGVQPARVDHVEGLSPIVQQAVHDVCAAIWQEINRIESMKETPVLGRLLGGQRMELPCLKF